MLVHLVDGTYELFRHFHGLRRFTKKDRPYGAVVGVLQSVLQMIEEGATHLGVATDHVVESFRNALWPGYKTAAGIESALLAQFHPLEEALEAMGVGDADGVRCKFGVEPALIADYLALVGDAADGFPGIAGIGPVGAAQMLNRHGAIETMPPTVLGDQRERALLFKSLATLRSDAALFRDVAALHWRGPTDAFAAWTERMDAPRLLERCHAAQAALAAPQAQSR